MKNAIKEYLELSDQEKSKLWDNAIFVFDTNVFLNLYRYSKKTRDALLDAMSRLSDRIWMPHHVATEFMNNRLKVISTTVKQYEDLHSEGQKFVDQCTRTFRINSSETECQKLQDYINNWIETRKKENLAVESLNNDLILEFILKLYDNKVGTKLDDNQIKEIKQEGKYRYDHDIPPGYMDKNKSKNDDDNNAYGDFILWKEILGYSSKNAVNIILVTNDQKEDWWNKVDGKTIGPRVELRKEFMDETSQIFHMYTVDSFIQRINEDNKTVLQQSIIDEIRDASESMKILSEVVPLSKEIDANERAALINYIKTKISSLSEKNFKRQAALLALYEEYMKEYQNTPISQEKIIELANFTHKLNEETAELEEMEKYLETFVSNMEQESNV